jgi:hypothetical protein
VGCGGKICPKCFDLSIFFCCFTVGYSFAYQLKTIGFQILSLLINRSMSFEIPPVKRRYEALLIRPVLYDPFRPWLVAVDLPVHGIPERTT